MIKTSHHVTWWQPSSASEPWSGPTWAGCLPTWALKATAAVSPVLTINVSCFIRNKWQTWWPWVFSNTLPWVAQTRVTVVRMTTGSSVLIMIADKVSSCVSVAKLNTPQLWALGMAPSLQAPALTGSSHWSLSVSEVGPAPALLDSGWGRGGLPWHYHWHCHHREFTIHSPFM